MNQTQLDPLHRLARLYRIMVSCWDSFGVLRQASPETLLAVLRELGAPVESATDVPRAIQERHQTLWRRFVEPVSVVWGGGPAHCLLRVPVDQNSAFLSCQLEFEHGEIHEWQCRLSGLPTRRPAEVSGMRFLAKTLAVPVELPWGYHRLRLEMDRRIWETLIISAPSAAHSGAEAREKGLWGLFLPLYALHSERSWGTGDFTDFAGLIDWAAGLGANLWGALPLLAAFLDNPCDPSPYTPVSRQFWNELYLDVNSAPEFDRSPAAKRLLSSAAFTSQIDALRKSDLVDYRREMALKRRVLEELVKALISEPSERQEAFRRYVDEHPTLESYARFRAAVERTRKLWPEWPSSMRDGEITPRDFDEPARLYHLYVQWLADEQLGRLAENARRSGPGLYLDLPLGVHSAGFDVWKEPESFALGVSGGAPPDKFFTKGQNWGFAPSHPESARERGYRSFIACVRQHLKYAGVLRIDHVMGLHRLYWIPKGLPATQGVYVRYPSDELYAILNVESRRGQATIVGEDLGTVPNIVRHTMASRGMQRMYVLQFEFAENPKQAIRSTPADSLACLNTHDMRPFAGFWEGCDIDDQLEMKLLDRDEAKAEQTKRQAIKAAVIPYLQERGWLSQEPDLAAILRACLNELAVREAAMVLVNLEDLWLEKFPQNTPGTVDERPNWRRRARHSLEEFRRMPEVVETLRRIDELRRR